MTDTFEAVIDEYTHQWLDALDALLEPFPFAAACLACVSLDHLGNAIGRGTARKRGSHRSEYLRFIREFLSEGYQGADAFPDDESMRDRLYTVLRNGLVHEARTDDHQTSSVDAALVRISHEDFAPFMHDGDMILSVPWLVRCVRRAWVRLRSAPDGEVRERVTARLQLVIHEVPPPRVIIPDANEVPTSTLSSLSPSGFGSNFLSPSESLEILAYEREQQERRHITTRD